MEDFLHLFFRIVMIAFIVFLIITFFPVILLILLILLITGNIAMIRTISIFDRFRRAQEEADKEMEEQNSSASVSDGDAIDAEVIHAETVDKK